VAVTRPHPHPIRRYRRSVAALVLAAFALAPGSALAGGETLKRSVGNILQAPIDLALSPVTAAFVEQRNIRAIDDTPGVRIAYALPGYFWLTGLTAGASVLRLLAGAFELLPGMLLLFTDAELDPLFEPGEREAALLDQPTPVIDIRIGVDYTAAPL